jgi:hypothetical protein
MTKNSKFHVRRGRRYVLDSFLGGDLAGAHIVMSAITGREMRDMANGSLSEGQILDLLAKRVVEHNLDVEDVLDMEQVDLMAIVEAWTKAQDAGALDPTPASS